MLFAGLLRVSGYVYLWGWGTPYDSARGLKQRYRLWTNAPVFSVWLPTGDPADFTFGRRLFASDPFGKPGCKPSTWSGAHQSLVGHRARRVRVERPTYSALHYVGLDSWILVHRDRYMLSFIRSCFDYPLKIPTSEGESALDAYIWTSDWRSFPYLTVMSKRACISDLDHV